MCRERVISGGLAIFTAVSLLCPVAQAAKPVVDEAYYGVLDYYGALQEGSVVKSYYTNGNTILRDVGVYDEVENLTDRTEPVVSGESVTFDFGEEAPKNFYFQGKTAQPFRDLPFTISVSYKMNGVETDGEDMAGQAGMAEITLDVLPNPAASEYQRNNFVLEAMTMLRDTDTLSVEAEGGQVQKVGNTDAVLYAVLPGEEQHFTLRIGTENFSFAGFTFLLEPATLAQLDMVADIKEARGEVEDSYHAVTDSLNEILTRVEGLDSKLRDSAGGLDQLNEARETLSAGKQKVYDEADRMLTSMAELRDSLAPVVEHLQTAKTAIQENMDRMTALSDTVSGLQPKLNQLSDHLDSIQNDTKKLRELLEKEEINSRAISDVLRDLEKELEYLESNLDTVGSRTGTLSAALSELASDGVLNRLDMDRMTITKNGRTFTVKELKEYYRKASQIYQICEGIAAKTGETSPTDETSYVTFVLTHKDLIAGVIAEQQKISLEEATAMLTEDNVKLLAYLYYNWKQGEDINGQISTYEGVVNTANESIDNVNKSLRDVANPTADLLDSLKELTSDITAGDGLLDQSRNLLGAAQAALNAAVAYDYDPVIDHATDLLEVTEKLIGQTKLVIDKGTELSDTVTKYNPNVQSALDDAQSQVNAVVYLVDEMNQFGSTVENLMKSADEDLDEGSKKTLTGLSESLRQMADTLKSTPAIRKANEKVETLTEEKWHEYTGEKNNALNMDSKAEKVSLTSAKNQSPNTLQIVLRTQEIKIPENKKVDSASDPEENTTFWQRVGQMFKDIAGIFMGYHT